MGASIGTPETKKVLFMKKMDAHGEVVTIKVPEYLKGLTIGKGAKNLKRIASTINAKRIFVE